MFGNRHPVRRLEICCDFIKSCKYLNYIIQGPPQGGGGQPVKFTVVEACERIKEEFNYLQAQYHK